MIRPSAPATMAALERGSTSQVMPVAWLGSTTTGRWETRLRMGTAEMSRVFLV